MGMNMSISLSTLSDCKCSGNFKLISVKNLHLTLYAQSIMYGVTVESLSKSQLKTSQSFIKPVFMCWVFQKVLINVDFLSLLSLLYLMFKMRQFYIISCEYIKFTYSGGHVKHKKLYFT
jgi:hypothetical protein